jgi:hypothetical protein
MRIGLRHRAFRLGRAAIAVLVLIALTFGVCGIPTVKLARKDRSRPFPCQDRPCGCASAEECWKACCCFSHREKLAWARKHGVTPPESVVAAAAHEAGGSVRPCCRESFSRVDARREHSCCRLGAPHAASQEASRSPDCSQSRQVRVVLSDLARQCRGLPSIVMLFADALPGVAVVEWNPVENPVGFVIEAPLSRPSVDLAPPVPPPRLSCDLAAGTSA